MRPGGPASPSARVACRTCRRNAPADLDTRAQAQMLAADVGAQLTAFVADPVTALVLANVERPAGRSATPTRPAGWSSGAAAEFPGGPAGTVWGLPAERMVTAVRRDADVKADGSVFSTSDRVAVRATCRVAFGSPHTA